MTAATVSASRLRPLRVLVPGTGARFRGGGLLAELEFAELASATVPVEVVTYRERQPDHPFLDDLLQAPPDDAYLWVVSWGFDVPKLLRRLRGRPVVYHAHSSGYGFRLPAGVPVIAVSHHTLAHWGALAARSPLYCVPNPIEERWQDRGLTRDIDVLVQARKSSDYLLQRLVPALREVGVRVEVQSGWVDDLTELFNRARIYTYDSADYWLGRGVTEGFGLPPLEAIACGCTVFSSLNHALADYLVPGETAYQLGAGSLEADVERIRAVLAGELPGFDNRALVARYRPAVIREQLTRVLAEVNRDWDRWGSGALPLAQPQPRRLRWQQRWQRLRRRLGH